MKWSELYHSENQPTDKDIGGFIGNDLWRELNAYLQETYSIQPKMTYSNCSMGNGLWKGWNVKYQKSGKALCTLYPRVGLFVAMVVIGAKEMTEAELLIPMCNEYTQKIFNGVEVSMGGKWLAMEVTNNDILSDVKSLIALRMKSKQKIRKGEGK